MSKKPPFNKFQEGGRSNRRDEKRTVGRTRPRPNIISNISQEHEKLKETAKYIIPKEYLDCKDIKTDPNNPNYSIRSRCIPSDNMVLPNLPIEPLQCRGDRDCRRNQICVRGICYDNTGGALLDPIIIDDIGQEEFICNGDCVGGGPGPEPSLTYDVEMTIESYLVDTADGYVDTWTRLPWAYSQPAESGGIASDSYYYFERWLRGYLNLSGGDIQISGIVQSQRSFDNYTVSFEWTPGGSDPDQITIQNRIDSLNGFTLNVANFTNYNSLLDQTCESWNFVTCQSGTYAGSCQLSQENCFDDSITGLLHCGKTNTYVNSVEECYQTGVLADGKTWLLEDLQQTKLSNDEVIQEIFNNDWLTSNEWPYLQTPVMFESADNQYLYNFAAVDSGVCPEGWHTPNKQEWLNLFQAYGGVDVAAEALKSVPMGGDNSSGFSVLPKGFVINQGGWSLGFQNEANFYWSSTEIDDIISWVYGFSLPNNSVLEFTDYQNAYIANLLSVRCIKGAEQEFDPGGVWYQQKEEYNFLGWRPAWLCILQPEECNNDLRSYGFNNDPQFQRDARQIAQSISDGTWDPQVGNITRDGYSYDGEFQSCPEHPVFWDASQPSNQAIQFPNVDVGEMPSGCWRKTYTDLGTASDMGCCDNAVNFFGENFAYGFGLNDCRITDSLYLYYCGGCNCQRTPNSFYYDSSLIDSAGNVLRNDTYNYSQAIDGGQNGNSFGLGPSCPEVMCVGGDHNGKYCDPSLTGGVDPTTCRDAGGYGCSMGSGCSWGHKFDLGYGNLLPGMDPEGIARSWWNIHDRSCCPGAGVDSPCAHNSTDPSCIGYYDILNADNPDIDWGARYNYSEVPIATLGIPSAQGEDWVVPPTNWTNYCLSICEHYTDHKTDEMQTSSCFPQPADMCSQHSTPESCGSWEIDGTGECLHEYQADGSGIVGGCCGWSYGLDACVYKGCSAYHECASRCLGEEQLDPTNCIDYCQPDNEWGMSLCMVDSDGDSICDPSDTSGVDPDLGDVIAGFDIDECSGNSLATDADFQACPYNCFDCNGDCCPPGTGECNVVDECNECVTQANINYLDTGCGCNAGGYATYYYDADGDGLGNSSDSILVCIQGGYPETSPFTLTTWTGVTHYPNVDNEEVDGYVPASGGADPDDDCPCGTSHLVEADGSSTYCNGCCIPPTGEPNESCTAANGYQPCAQFDACNNCITVADLPTACVGTYDNATCGEYLNLYSQDVLGNDLVDAGCDMICNSGLEVQDYYWDSDGDGVGVDPASSLCPSGDPTTYPCNELGTAGWCSETGDLQVGGADCWCPEQDYEIDGVCIDCNGDCRQRNPLTWNGSTAESLCQEGSFTAGCAYLDDCGVCSMGGVNPPHIPNSDQDCEGVCFGELEIDDCGICGGAGRVFGCNGEVVGYENLVCGVQTGLCESEIAENCSVVGDCGECGVNFSVCESAGGDYCGEGVYCVSGDIETYPITNCDIRDCAGVCGGIAQTDECGDCYGGTTSCTEEQNSNIPPIDINGNPTQCVPLSDGSDGGTFNVEGVCCKNYMNKGCGCDQNPPTLHSYDEDGDGYPTCGGQTGFPDTNYCITGFDGTYNTYTIFGEKPANTDCDMSGNPAWCELIDGTPVNGCDAYPDCFNTEVDGSQITPYDCNGDCGGTAFIDDCGECVEGNTGLEENYLQDCSGACTCVDEGDFNGGDSNGVAINCTNTIQTYYRDEDGDGLGDLGLDGGTASTCDELSFCVPLDDTSGYSPNCTDTYLNCYTNAIDWMDHCVPHPDDPNSSSEHCPYPTYDGVGDIPGNPNAAVTTTLTQGMNDPQQFVSGCGVASDACGQPCAGYGDWNGDGVASQGPLCSFWISSAEGEFGGLKDCNDKCPIDGADYGAVIDDCGSCTGGSTGNDFNYLMDCRYDGDNPDVNFCSNHASYTEYAVDECGVCTPTSAPTPIDCHNVCNGSNIFDTCGICSCPSEEAFEAGDCGSNDYIYNSAIDCAGVCNGGSQIDGCGQCICGATASNTGCGHPIGSDNTDCGSCPGGACTCVGDVSMDLNYLDPDGCGCGYYKSRYCKDSDGDQHPDFPSDLSTDTLMLCANEFVADACASGTCNPSNFYEFVTQCGIDGGWCPCEGSDYDVSNPAAAGWDNYPNCECGHLVDELAGYCNGPDNGQCCNPDLVPTNDPLLAGACVGGGAEFQPCRVLDHCGNCGGDCTSAGCPTGFGTPTPFGGYNVTRVDCTGECVEEADFQVIDDCGICGGENSSQEQCCNGQMVCDLADCLFKINDCGDCVEFGNSSVWPNYGLPCDGGCATLPDGACDCNGNVLDECGVCGGDGIDAGACDCDGNVLDACGVCGGNNVEGSAYCGQCSATADSCPDTCCDCNGDPYGGAYMSDCGCVGGETPYPDGDWCDDCAGAPNGPGVFYDACGTEGTPTQEFPCGDGGCAPSGNATEVCSPYPDGACDCLGSIVDCADVCSGANGVPVSSVDVCGVCTTTPITDQEQCFDAYGNCDPEGTQNLCLGCDENCYDCDALDDPSHPGDLDDCGVCGGPCDGIPYGNVISYLESHNGVTYNYATNGGAGTYGTSDSPGHDNDCYTWNGGCFDCANNKVGAGGRSGFDIGGVCHYSEPSSPGGNDGVDIGAGYLDACNDYIGVDTNSDSMVVSITQDNNEGCRCAPACQDICDSDYHYTNRQCTYWAGNPNPVECDLPTNSRDYCGDGPLGAYPYCDSNQVVGNTWFCDDATGCGVGANQICDNINDMCDGNVAYKDSTCEGSPGSAACVQTPYDCTVHTPNYEPTTYPYCEGDTSHTNGFCTGQGVCSSSTIVCTDIEDNCSDVGAGEIFYLSDYYCNDSSGECQHGAVDYCGDPNYCDDDTLYIDETCSSAFDGCYYSNNIDCGSIPNQCAGDGTTRYYNYYCNPDLVDSGECDFMMENCDTGNYCDDDTNTYHYDLRCLGGECVDTPESCNRPAFCTNNIHYADGDCDVNQGGCIYPEDNCAYHGPDGSTSGNNGRQYPFCDGDILYTSTGCTAANGCGHTTQNCAPNGFSWCSGQGSLTFNTGAECSGADGAAQCIAATQEECDLGVSCYDSDTEYTEFTCDNVNGCNDPLPINDCSYTTGQCVQNGGPYGPEMYYHNGQCTEGTVGTERQREIKAVKPDGVQGVEFAQGGIVKYDSGGLVFDDGMGDVIKLPGDGSLLTEFGRNSGCVYDVDNCTPGNNNVMAPTCCTTSACNTDGSACLSDSTCLDYIHGNNYRYIASNPDCNNGSGCNRGVRDCSDMPNMCGFEAPGFPWAVGDEASTYAASLSTFNPLPPQFNPATTVFTSANVCGSTQFGSPYCLTSPMYDCSWGICDGDIAKNDGYCQQVDGGDSYCGYSTELDCSDKGGCIESFSEDFGTRSRCACPHGYKTFTMANGEVRSVCITDCMAAAPYCKFNHEWSHETGVQGDGSWTPDGMCDTTCNYAECGYDFGDCCEQTCVDRTHSCNSGPTPYQCIDPSVEQSGPLVVQPQINPTCSGPNIVYINGTFAASCSNWYNNYGWCPNGTFNIGGWGTLVADCDETEGQMGITQGYSNLHNAPCPTKRLAELGGGNNQTHCEYHCQCGANQYCDGYSSGTSTNPNYSGLQGCWSCDWIFDQPTMNLVAGYGFNYNGVSGNEFGYWPGIHWGENIVLQKFGSNCHQADDSSSCEQLEDACGNRNCEWTGGDCECDELGTDYNCYRSNCVDQQVGRAQIPLDGTNEFFEYQGLDPWVPGTTDDSCHGHWAGGAFRDVIPGSSNWKWNQWHNENANQWDEYDNRYRGPCPDGSGLQWCMGKNLYGTVINTQTSYFQWTMDDFAQSSTVLSGGPAEEKPAPTPIPYSSQLSMEDMAIPIPEGFIPIVGCTTNPTFLNTQPPVYAENANEGGANVPCNSYNDNNPFPTKEQIMSMEWVETENDCCIFRGCMIPSANNYQPWYNAPCYESDGSGINPPIENGCCDFGAPGAGSSVGGTGSVIGDASFCPNGTQVVGYYGPLCCTGYPEGFSGGQSGASCGNQPGGGSGTCYCT